MVLEQDESVWWTDWARAARPAEKSTTHERGWYLGDNSNFLKLRSLPVEHEVAHSYVVIEAHAFVGVVDLQSLENLLHVNFFNDSKSLEELLDDDVPHDPVAGAELFDEHAELILINKHHFHSLL